MKRRITIAGAVVAGLASLALVGCGGSEKKAPTADQMITRAVSAMQDQNSAAFRLEATINGKTTDPSMTEFFSEPINIGASGAFSPGALKLEGTLGAAGETLTAGLLGDSKQSFIKWGEQWYGPSTGIDELTDKAKGKAADKGISTEDLADLEGLLKGKVTEGPEEDGQKTWAFEGTIDPQAVIALSEKQGDKVTAEDRKEIEALADSLVLRIHTGQDDDLPRLLNVQLDEFAAGDDTTLSIDFGLELSDWGKPVEVSEPSGTQPMKALEEKVEQWLNDALTP